MKTINQLILSDKGELIEGEKAFLETHEAIMRCGSIAIEFEIKLALNLKKMRDNKLYKVAEFATFEDYIENEVGLKRSQAYKYIKVVETFGEQFVHSSGQNLGITKLEMLARLTDEERAQINTQTKVEDVSVSELKKQIEILKQEKAEAFRQLEFDVAEESKKLAEELVKNQEEMARKFQAELEEKNKQLKAASEASPDVELQARIDELEEELEALKSKPAEKQIVKDEKTVAELAAAKEQLTARDNLIKEKEQELLKAKKQLEHAGDEALLKFKFKFEEFKIFLQDLFVHLNAVSADKQEGCKKAIKTVVGGLAI